MTVRPRKLTASLPIASELAEDSDGMLSAVQNSIARALARGIDAASIWDDLGEGMVAITTAGGNPTALFASPSAYDVLLSTRDSEGRPLIVDVNSSAISPLGLMIIPSNSVPDGKALMVDPSVCGMVLRRNIDVQADSSILFRSDSVAIRATARMHPVVLDSDGLVLVDVTTPAS